MFRIPEESAEFAIRRLSEAQRCQDSIHCLWGRLKKGDKNCQYPDERLCPLLKFKWELEGATPAFMGFYQKASEYYPVTQDNAMIELEGDDVQKQEARKSLRDLHRFRQITLIELYSIYLANDEKIPNITKDLIEKTAKGFSLEPAYQDLLKSHYKLVNFLESLFEIMETERRNHYRHFSYLFFKIFLNAVEQQIEVIEPLIPAEEPEFFSKIEGFLGIRRG